MADRMGAQLSGHSVPGQGSVFRLTLRTAPRIVDAPGGDGIGPVVAPAVEESQR
jgi:hypothetical protein